MTAPDPARTATGAAFVTLAFVGFVLTIGGLAFLAPLERPCRPSATLLDGLRVSAACPPGAELAVTAADPTGARWLVICGCPAALPRENPLLGGPRVPVH